MTQTDPPKLSPRFCTNCRSLNEPHLAACWLCLQPLSSAGDYVGPAEFQTSYEQLSTGEYFLRGTLIGIFILIVIVGIGIWLDNDVKGMLVPYLILTVPAIIAGSIPMVIGTAQGKNWGGRSLATFAITIAVIVAVAAILVVALIVAVFVLCLSSAL